MSDLYFDREQTRAKHFILRRYLQALAFKVLRYFDIAYVDGFSGPWKTESEDFVDSSFMIAISVLKDAQDQIYKQTGRLPKVRCFFSENNRSAYLKLSAAIAKYHEPDSGFEIKTYYGNFEDAVPEIRNYIGRYFPLIFIDPTGWTGYAFDKIKPLFESPKCEVLINFMYDFVNRAASMSDQKTIASLDPILGGANWADRLDAALPRGRAVEKLFRDTLRQSGDFDYVISTKIDRTTTDRPHFFIAYGTKSSDGLQAFRETEYLALRGHARERENAKQRIREAKTGARDMFSSFEAELKEASIDDLIEEQKKLAAEYLLESLKEFGLSFFMAWTCILERYMLRVTNVKDICVDLAKAGKIKNTWGTGNRKPRDENTIILS